MKPNSVQITRQQYAALRHARAAWRAERAEAQASRDRTVLESLARYAPRTRKAPPYLEPGDESPHVFHRAPRLSIDPYATAVRRLLQAARFRDDWSPRGRGRDALFRSLAGHHLARYPTPALLWTVFFDPFVEPLVRLVVRVAAGGSLFEHARETHFPVPLTRRICHEALTTPFRGSLLQAFRAAQARLVGADRSLTHAWLRTPAAQRLDSRDGEAFWLMVLAWLAKVPELDTSIVGLLADYVAHRRREDVSFSMSGRSLPALVRGMREWHRDLAQAQVLHDQAYAASGFEPLELDLSRRDVAGNLQKAIWRVEEILSNRDLAAEGKRMGHCVYSYSRYVENRQTSIWTMTLEDGRGETGRWAMLTIEVRNDLRRIVQARGRFNRGATSAEHQVLMRWAGQNDLAVTI